MANAIQEIKPMFQTAYSLGTGDRDATPMLLVASFKEVGIGKDQILFELNGILKDEKLFDDLVIFLLAGMRSARGAHAGLLSLEEQELIQHVQNNLVETIKVGIEICKKEV